MRYILPGLVYNNGAAPQTNISNNVFILRQGAWILSKILDDEHTEYGYETFHPAQRYVTAGGPTNAVSIDHNKRNAMMASLYRIQNMIPGLLSRAAAVALNHGELGLGAGNAYTIDGGGICSLSGHPPGIILMNYLNEFMNIIDNEFTFDDNTYEIINVPISALTNVVGVVGAGANVFAASMVNPGGGLYTAAEHTNIINSISGRIGANLIGIYNTLKVTHDNLYEIPFYIIRSLITLTVTQLGHCVGNYRANFTGTTIVDIIENCILSPYFINFLANLATTGIDGNRNHRKTSFFNHLTTPLPGLNTPIGLYVPEDRGSFIVPYTDYEERSESSGGNTIDNRDLLGGVPAGAEPRLNQVGDRIRNGRKGDHIATVLTPDDIRLLAIFLQLAAEHFNANTAKRLYNSNNDIIYKDHRHTRGLRNPGIIESYFDHLIALRETDHNVRRSSGLNQGKVEALSVLAGLRYAIQGPIFPVLSQTVFHLVAHYFVRLVVHDSRAPAGGGAAIMNFHNDNRYDAAAANYMRFLGGNGRRLQLLSQLNENDQVSITTVPQPLIFGYPGIAGFLPEEQPLIAPNPDVEYDHQTQVLNFIKLIQSFIAPGTINALNPASTILDQSAAGILNVADNNDSMTTTYDIIKKVHNDIHSFVTGTAFNYTFLENNNAGGALEPVFNAFAGSLAFHGHRELRNINLSTIEPTLFDADIRHLLKFNVTNKAIKVLGNEVHIIGSSTQNSFTGALIGPKQKLGSGGQFIINDYGVLEYQEIINGQVVQTDNSQLYNKMIGNNDYCKIFGSTRLDDPARDKGSVCNTMISACSIIGNYGDTKKCATAFREIQDIHVSKNLRGWNTLHKNISQLSAYKILIGMGFDPITNKDGDITFIENNNYIFDNQQIFDKLELSKGVVAAAPGGAREYPNPNTSNHVKYVQKLMDKVKIIKITKNPQDKNKDKNDIPTLKLFLSHQRKRVNSIQLGTYGLPQRGGNCSERQINIMYGGNNIDLKIVRKNIEEIIHDAKEKGVKFKKNQENKLNEIITNLEKDQIELEEIMIYAQAYNKLKISNGRNPLHFEIKKKIDELRNNINKKFTKIEKVKQSINAYLVVS